MRKGNESDVFAMIENAWHSTVIPFEQAMFEQDLRQTIKDLHALHVPVCRLVGNRGMPDGTSEMCMEVSEHLQNAMRVLREIQELPVGKDVAGAASSLCPKKTPAASDAPQTLDPPSRNALLGQHGRGASFLGDPPLTQRTLDAAPTPADSFQYPSYKPGASIYNLECRDCGEIFDEKHADRRTPEFEPAYIVCPECGCDELGDVQ